MTNYDRLSALNSHNPLINVWSPENLENLCLLATKLCQGGDFREMVQMINICIIVYGSMASIKSIN